MYGGFASGLEGRRTHDATPKQLAIGHWFDDTKARASSAAGALAIVSQLMVLHCAHEGDVRTPSECLKAFLGVRREPHHAAMMRTVTQFAESSMCCVRSDNCKIAALLHLQMETLTLPVESDGMHASAVVQDFICSNNAGSLRQMEPFTMCNRHHRGGPAVEQQPEAHDLCVLPQVRATRSTFSWRHRTASCAPP